MHRNMSQCSDDMKTVSGERERVTHVIIGIHTCTLGICTLDRDTTQHSSLEPFSEHPLPNESLPLHPVPNQTVTAGYEKGVVNSPL